MPETVNVLDGSIAVQIRGSGPPIVFVHGNSCSSRSFAHQLEGSLARGFRVIAIDLPGHGDSRPASAPDTAYTLEGYATVLADIAAELGVGHAVFAGWSLGGHILVEASERLAKAAGLFIFGAPPVATFAEFLGAAFNESAIQAAYREDSTEDEIRSLVALFVRRGASIPDVFLDDFKRTDKRARAALGSSASRGEIRDERNIVAQLRTPLAVVHGMQEQLIRRAYFDTLEMPSLWRGAVQEINGAGHAPHWETPRTFDQLLEAFAIDCGVHA